MINLLIVKDIHGKIQAYSGSHPIQFVEVWETADVDEGDFRYNGGNYVVEKIVHGEDFKLDPGDGERVVKLAIASVFAQEIAELESEYQELSNKQDILDVKISENLEKQKKLNEKEK